VTPFPIRKSSFAFHSVAHHAEVVPILPEFDRLVGSFDAHLIPHVIEQGARAAEEQLTYLRRLLATGP
jgi:NTE family protein